MKNIQKLEKQSGILRLLVFLDTVDEIMLSDIWDETGIAIHQGYNSVQKGKELGLIKSRIDNSSYPPKNMISLTEKGRKVAEHLKKIEELLQ